MIYRSALAEEISSLPVALNILAKAVSRKETVVLEIRHTFVVQDALREARKAKFHPSKLAKVSVKWNSAIITRHEVILISCCVPAGKICWRGSN